MHKPNRILLAEDDPRDVKLTLKALGEQDLEIDVVVVSDGEAVLDYLYRRGRFEQRSPGNPVVVLLDLKMPKIDGLEVLRQLKGDPELKLVPIVMLTSSREQRDLEASYRQGANAFVVKPVDFREFMDVVKQLGKFWAVTNEPPPGSAGRN